MPTDCTCQFVAPSFIVGPDCFASAPRAAATKVSCDPSACLHALTRLKSAIARSWLHIPSAVIKVAGGGARVLGLTRCQNATDHLDHGRFHQAQKIQQNACVEEQLRAQRLLVRQGGANLAWRCGHSCRQVVHNRAVHKVGVRCGPTTGASPRPCHKGVSNGDPGPGRWLDTH